MKAIFVNGCFWHGHTCKHGLRQPKTNLDYWQGKIARNILRDKRNEDGLQRLGWEVLTIWECEVDEMDLVMQRIVKFLN